MKKIKESVTKPKAALKKSSSKILKSNSQKSQTDKDASLILQSKGADSGLPKSTIEEIEDLKNRLQEGQETLRQSEDRYKTLFNTMMEGFCIVEVIFDPDGRPVDYRFLEINPSFEAQIGLQNARGRRMRELAPDHEAHWFEIYGKIALTGEPAHFEHEARALNHWYDVSAYRVGSPENRQVAIVFNDITGHKRTEEALRAQAALLDLAHDAILVRGTADEITFWNQGAERTYGWTHGEAMGRVTHALLKTRFPQPLAEISAEMAGKGNWEGELIHTRKDGREIMVASRWATQRDMSGHQVGVLEINRDITDRKQAEEVQGRLAAIIESADDAIIGKDLNGVIQSWNVGAENIFGYKAEEVIGKPVSLLVPPGHTDEVPEILARIKQGEHIEQFETVRMRKDGRIIPVSLTFSAVKDASGRIIGASKIAHDITERKRSELERERLVTELARSNKELEQFAYVASHDLQEPLRMVASYVQLLEKKYRGQMGDEADKYIHFAADGAVRMQKLIEGLLAYSRITRKGVEFGTVDTNNVFSQAVSNLSAAIRESNAEVTKDDLPTITGDETQLIQLFQNLIGNAIKFRKRDTAPAVHVSVRQQKEDWVFSILDNGIGIEPEYYPKIFLIFQRPHTREEYPGTGIGLALCKRIVELHGGRIWVESVPGEGTTFFFNFPKEAEYDK